MKITIEQIIEAIECEFCGAYKVYGAEELLIMGGY